MKTSYFLLIFAIQLFVLPQLTAQIFTDIQPLEEDSPASIATAITFDIDFDKLNKRLETKSTDIVFKLPFITGQLQLELSELQIHSESFRVVEKSESGEKVIDYQAGKYYQGKVSGSANSRAIISVHSNEIGGVIVYEGRNYNFGKMRTSDLHILYASDKRAENKALKCATNTDDIKPTKQTFKKSSGSCSAAVEIYFECDYEMYQSFGSNSTSVTNYVNSMFADVNTIYNNESITIQISEIMVWTSNDGYSSGTAGLSDFANANSSGFNGDLAHLLTNDPGSNGGVAYVDQLCGNSPFAYSDIVNTSSAYPTYSWDVQVVTHELGHNFGSSHTHDCVWGPNNNEQIDDCGNIALGSGGSCYNASNPIVPSSGGTVMSYCHLNAVGINFSNGFGPQPGNLIRQKHTSCMCDNSTCAEALVITGSGTYFAQPNNGNGASSSSATHADWFEFTPTSGGSIDIYSCNEGVDTRVWLHSGSCSSLNNEAMSDDDCTSSGNSSYASEIVNFSVSAGTTYFIEWDNRWSTGSFDWNLIFAASSGGNVDISCPQAIIGASTCNPSDYDPVITGTATSTTLGATVNYSDFISNNTCSTSVSRTWTATDLNGNTAICAQQIDLVDTQGPTVTSCPSNITVTSGSNCLAIVTWSDPTAVDNCTTLTISSNYNSGASFPIGITQVAYTIADACANTSYCNFDVEVLDGCSDDCDSTNIVLTGAIMTGTYNAQQSLNAAGIIPQNQTPVLKAGQAIELTAGFEVSLGGTLEALIQDCNN